MSFIRKYGGIAVGLLIAYGLFILGGIAGFGNITGNAISSFEYNKIWIVYGVVGFLVIALVFILGWLVVHFIKKRNKKKKVKEKKRLKSLEKEAVKVEKQIKEVEEKSSKEISSKEISLGGESSKRKSFFSFLKRDKNKKINKLLLEGGRALSEQDVFTAEEIYEEIKKSYKPKNDEDREVYQRVLNYYQNILKEKKKK